jgi:hypothetical protein
MRIDKAWMESIGFIAEGDEFYFRTPVDRNPRAPKHGSQVNLWAALMEGSDTDWGIWLETDMDCVATLQRDFRTRADVLKVLEVFGLIKEPRGDEDAIPATDEQEGE